MALRRALLITLLLATPFAAGCNLNDWYNQRGTVYVDLNVVGGADSALSEFKQLDLVLVSVSLRQVGTVEVHNYNFNPAPVIDLVKISKEGGHYMLVNGDKFNLRAVGEVIVRIETIENGTILASGKAIPTCYPGVHAPSHPCLSIPTSKALIFGEEDKPFSPPRGGSATFHFPVAVKFERNPDEEYFLQNDPSLITIDTHR